MNRHIASLAAVLGLVSAAAFLAGQEAKPQAAKPVEGTLLLSERTYKFAHVVAYETKPDDETLINVLVSDRRIPVDQIKEALRKGDGNDKDLSLRQPYLKVVFGGDGKPRWSDAWADNSFFSDGTDLEGELKVEAGRVRGQAKMPTRGDRPAFKRGFDVRFDVAVGLDAAASTTASKAAAKRTGPVKASVSGTFKGNGKAAKLAFVSARPGEEFNDKPSILLVFTERDHSRDKRPDFKASFGDYGSALVISLHEDGSIFSCQVAHAAHSKQGFSSIGSIKTPAFDVEDGQVSGHIATDGEVETFGETWQVDIKFTAPFAAPNAKAAPAKTAVANARSAKAPANKPPASADPAKAKPAPKPEPIAVLNVRDLALPADAADFEYKTIVEQMVYKSPATVKAHAAELLKKLGAQGWKGGDGNLITADVGILNLTRGEATLTIFVKPATKGSTVTMFTTGLDWEEKAK